MLTKVISALGNSNCLPLDQNMLKQLGAERGSVVKIKFEGNKMIVEAMTIGEQKKMIMNSGRAISKRFARMMKKLAE